jgi:type I restriction enzyme S subunit
MLDERQITKRFLAPYLRNTDVQWDGINVDDLPEMDFDESEQKVYALRPGDILMCEGGEIGRCAIWDSDRRCFYQKALHRLRPTTDKDDPRYFVLVMRAAVDAGLFSSQASAATIQHLPAEKLRIVRYPAPPIEEQHAIVDRVSRQTARLDALVVAKQRLLDLLAEKRTAIIATAVTRGLDPKVKLRDSGVPWLGEIPAHWDLRRAKYLFLQSALPVATGDEIVTCFRDGQVTLRRNRREEGFTNADLEVGYQGIRQGQLVLHSMDAFAGAIGVSDSNGRCSPEYIICDPLDDGIIVPEYFGPLLRTMALAGFIQASCPAVRERAPRIRFNNFGEMYLPVPPTEEQQAIVEHIARETAKLDAVRAATERTIALLKERRAALIAAAVTGQLDVGPAA